MDALARQANLEDLAGPSIPAHELSRHQREDAAVMEIDILLLPGFSQLSLAALIQPLHLANRLSGKTLFHWQLMSIDGGSVESASGISMAVDCALAKQKTFRPCVALAVCAGEGVEKHSTHQLRTLLRGATRTRAPIYALGTATWLLADAGLLAGTNCTIHWDKMAALAETFHDLSIDDALFVRDGQVVTCAGELAAVDLAIDLIRRSHGEALSIRICQHLTADSWRDGASSQSVPPGLRHNAGGKQLIQIIRLMESNIEEPLALIEIARRVQLSRRQVERLFRRLVSSTPRRYYIRLRLLRARQLIESLDMPVAETAAACGFASATYFSKSFKGHFDILPSDL